MNAELPPCKNGKPQFSVSMSTLDHDIIHLRAPFKPISTLSRNILTYLGESIYRFPEMRSFAEALTFYDRFAPKYSAPDERYLCNRVLEPH